MSHRLLAASWVLAVSACALDFPDYGLHEGGTSVEGGASAGADAGGGGAGGGSPIGSPCSSDDACMGGACLASNTGRGKVCCAKACTDMGADSCGTNGTCDASGADCALYPAGTPCGEPSCEVASQTTPRCEAAVCVPGEPVACPNGLACENERDCKLMCETQDDCANPQDVNPAPDCIDDACTLRPPGVSCSVDSDCESGICGAQGPGHCCASSCAHLGEPCGPIDCDEAGACVYPGPETSCGDDPTCASATIESQRCNLAGLCGTQRSAEPCPGHLGCSSNASCHSSCGSNDATGDARCAAGHWCDGSTCHPGAPEGGSCLRDGQCSSNQCTAAGLCSRPGCDLDDDEQLGRDAACGGLDCDDNDARVLDGQTEYFDTPRVSGSYDFDCDGTSEPALPTSCSCPGQVLMVPAGAEGCGMSGPLMECNWTWFIFCMPTRLLDDSVTQSCR